MPGKFWNKSSLSIFMLFCWYFSPYYFSMLYNQIIPWNKTKFNEIQCISSHVFQYEHNFILTICYKVWACQYHRPKDWRFLNFLTWWIDSLGDSFILVVSVCICYQPQFYNWHIISFMYPVNFPYPFVFEQHLNRRPFRLL